MVSRLLYWITFSIVILGSFIFLWHLTTDYGGTDLRCRIVGSRLLTIDKSPYFYKWDQLDGERLLDPNDAPNRKVNGNVCTPALLLLNAPLAHFKYGSIRIVWTVLQFALLIGACCLLYFSGEKNRKTKLVLIMALLIFLFSNIWYYNIERGQTYILYTFIFSLCYFIYNSKLKHKDVVCGFILGTSIWIRPLFLFVNIPFYLNKNYKWVLGSLVGMLVGLLVFFIPLRKQWSDYSAAMKVYEAETLGKGDQFIFHEQSNIPEIIEGSSNITHFKQAFQAGGLATFQQYCNKYSLFLNSFALMGVFAIIIGGFSLFYFKNLAFDFPSRPDLLFSIAFLFYMLSELFIVGSRGGYNCIQWLFPTFIIAANTKKRFLVVLLVAGIFFMNGLPVTFPAQYSIGEAIMFLTLLIFIAERIKYVQKKVNALRDIPLPY